MQPIDINEVIQTRLDLQDEIYKAEIQINEGRGIFHEDAKRMVVKNIKSGFMTKSKFRSPKK